MVEVEELGRDDGPVDYGPNGAEVVDLIARARRVTPAQARALAGAASWHWVPLALPGRGSVAAARSDAHAAARVAGRSAAASAAEADARLAAVESPGGLATARRWSWAEGGLAVLGAGIIGVILAATSGLVLLALALGVAALAGGVVVLLYESSLVTRARLQACAGAAALALVVRDVIDPETFDALSAPWAAVMHD